MSEPPSEVHMTENASRLEPKETKNVFQLVAPAVDIFVDGVASMMASGGVVRLSLHQEIATPFESSKSEKRIVVNVFIPIEGYYRLGEYIANSIKDMAAKGFITMESEK